MFDFSGGFGTVTGMKRSRIEAGIFAACAALCLALACGCGRASEDRRDARDRNLRRAQAARDAEDLDAAVRWGEKALARRPDSPRAHRELALIYHHFKQDYVPALYHYRRYLELRPDAADRADVEDMLAKCGRAFAAQVAAAPADQPVAVPIRAEPPPAPAAAAVSPAPAAAAPVHVVQPGETLGTISARYYGTPAKWSVLFNANRDRVPDANNVRVGTRLDIPPP